MHVGCLFTRLKTSKTYDFTNTCKTIGQSISVRVSTGSPNASNEKQQQDKTQNSRSRSSVHHHTTPLVPESRLEPSTAILVNQIPEPRLTAKLVHPLGDFVSGGVSQSGEQGQEL